MTQTALSSLGNFTVIDADMEDSAQQFCPCCQHSYSWGDGVTECVPTELSCGHTLCSTCVKTQWLEVGETDDTVFCMTCSKRVGILSLKKYAEQGAVDNVTNSASAQNLKESSHMDLLRTDELIKNETIEETEDNSSGDGGVLAQDTKDGILLQEWVNANMPENFVLQLVTSNNDHSIMGNTYILDNGLVVQTGGSESHDDQSIEPKLENQGENNFSSISEGVTLQSNMIGSPDLNLKALLQMLEKSSEPSLGSNVEGCDMNQDQEMANFNNSAHEEGENNSGYMDALSVQPGQDIDLEVMTLSDKSLCDQLDMDNQWRPVGIMQHTPFVQSHEKNPLNHPVPCALYLHGRNVLPYNEKSNCLTLDCLSSQSAPIHDVGKMNNEPPQNVWLTQVHRGMPQKNNPRARRGRKKKPLRHFQSEFFMRPYSKRENSPQLQLVKLVRQRAQEKKEEEEKAAEVIMASSEKSHDRTETEKGSLEDPELAFMKTVDMPSGKRVEDIYVVPSVWISNEKKNAGKSSCSKEPISSAASNLYNYFPIQTPQRIPVQVYSQASRSHFFNSGSNASYVKHFQGYGQHPTAPPPPPPIQIPTVRTMHSATTGDICKPAQNMYKIIKGHIITTLNAPKLGPVPTLRDMCKAALGFQTHSTAETSCDSSYSYLNGHQQHCGSMLKARAHVDEIRPEIKSPKEFLDMKGGVAHHELKLPDNKSEANQAKDVSGEENFLKEIIISHKDTSSVTQDFCGANHSLPCLADDNCNSIGDMYDSRLADKFSDSEETLPENPLVTEDVKKLDRMKPVLSSSSLSDIHIRPGDFKVDMQQFDQAGDGASARSTVVSNSKESLKGLYSGNNSGANLSISNSDYVIPIVSYKIKEPVKNSFHNNSKQDPRQQEHNMFSKNDSSLRNFIPHTFNTPLYPSNTYPMYYEQPNSDEAGDGEPQGLPSLAGITKQIKCLSSFEPLNKQLANLASSLNLLCNAEKTLYESNFVVFRQMKSENESKLGRLNVCIRKLGDAIVTVGCTLQQWSKPTSNRCFKTMGVLTDLYTSNILGLIELITPYFHYVCELIASCHSDIMLWNKQLNVNNEQPNCMMDSAQMDPSPWHDVSTISSCSKPMPTFSYGETSKSSSPKDFSRQDYDQSLSSEDFMDRESEASNSGHTSAKTSPKLKALINTRRGRPIGSKNGQRRSRNHQGKFKLRRRSPMSGNHNSLTEFHNPSSSCQPNMLLPNTILVSMSSENFWNEANATILNQPQDPGHMNITAQCNDDKSKRNPASTSSWMLQADTEGDCHSMGSQLNISPDHCDARLSLMNQDYHNDLEVAPDLINVSSKDTSSESSPNKKAKMEDDTSHCSNIIFGLSKGINIVLKDSALGDEQPAIDIDANSEKASNEDLQNFQNNIFFIKTSDTSDDELQLDNSLFSTALISSLKGNKEMQDKFQIAFLQGCPSAELGGGVKTLMGDSPYLRMENGSKLTSQLGQNISHDPDDYGTITDGIDTLGDLCQNHESIERICHNDEYDLASHESNHPALLPNTSFDENLTNI